MSEALTASSGGVPRALHGSLCSQPRNDPRTRSEILRMRYVMRQKLLSWGDDFVIRDESGRDVFYVDGKAFSIGNQLSFQDMQGKELAYIRQLLLAWGATCEIYGRAQRRAIVKKEICTR